MNPGKRRPRTRGSAGEEGTEKRREVRGTGPGEKEAEQDESPCRILEILEGCSTRGHLGATPLL